VLSGRFWDELRERFPEMDEAERKRFVWLYVSQPAVFFIGYGLAIWLSHNRIFSRYLGFLAIWFGIQFWVDFKMERKWPDFRKKLKGTLLRKAELVLILSAAVMLWIWMDTLDQADLEADNTRTFPSVEAGVRAYGQEVELPTFVPFAVKSTESEIHGDSDLHVAYYSDTSRFNIHFAPWMELWISRSPHDMPKGKKLKLKNGTEAVFGHRVPEEPVLVWQSHGFWYELTMQRDFTEYSEQDFVKVADSFRIYKPQK
jgi:hypothetical protein